MNSLGNAIGGVAHLFTMKVPGAVQKLSHNKLSNSIAFEECHNTGILFVDKSALLSVFNIRWILIIAK